MGIIMRNNIAYSGGGGSETVELSMAEYEAREAAGAIDSDTWYLIYDANDSYNAKKIVYDNAESGMEASTVQGAIDELNSNLESEKVIGFYMHSSINSTLKVADYPDGFNRDNCWILGGSQTDADGNFFTPLVNMTVILKSDGIYGYLGHEACAGALTVVFLRKTTFN